MTRSILTKVPRPKQARFQAEADMLSPLAARRSVLAPSCTITVFEVPTLASGVPDLIFIDLDQEALDARPTQATITDIAGVKVMLYLSPENRTSLQELSRATGLSRTRLKNSILPHLDETGHVLHVDSDAWISTYSFRSLARHLVTVEAKTRDWLKGMGQAIRHSSTSDASWLVLDGSYVPPIEKAVTLTDAYGVGLAGITPDGKIHILLPPSPRPTIHLRREILVERAITLWLSGRVSGPVPHVYGRTHLASRGCDPRLLGELVN
jgi:hypothetical protein